MAVLGSTWEQSLVGIHVHCRTHSGTGDPTVAQETLRAIGSFVKISDQGEWEEGSLK